MTNKIRSLVALLFILFPSVVLAQDEYKIIPTNPGLPSGIGDTPTTISGQITGIIMLLLQIIGLIAVVMIVYGGFRYITSGGDEKVVESAKKTLTNSIIGLVIIILSYIIVRAVIYLSFGRT